MSRRQEKIDAIISGACAGAALFYTLVALSEAFHHRFGWAVIYLLFAILSGWVARTFKAMGGTP